MIPCNCCPARAVRCRPGTQPPAFARNLGSAGRTAGPGPNTFTFANFAGSGVDVQVTSTSAGVALGGGAANLSVSPAGPARANFTIAFSAPVVLRRLGLSDLDFGLNEQAMDFVPGLSGVDGQHILSACDPTGGPTPGLNPLGCVHGNGVPNAAGGVLFPSPVTSTLTFAFGRPGGAGQFLDSLSIDLNTQTFDPVYAFYCGGVITWYDLAGNVVNPATLVACP